MSLTFKLGSLAIRTIAKPLSNYIKRNATEHDNFRALCVGFAQRLHRVDMRLRLGLLQDPAAIERQIQRELRDAERKRAAQSAPTVKTEAETLADKAAKSKERKEVEDHVKAAHKPPRIRPLSESKAIETGANFIAETFLFLIAGGLILAESWRRDRREKKQDADVADALAVAEREREEMKNKLTLLQAEIEALMDDKKPFDSVRAAAVASLRQMPSTVSHAVESVDSTKALVTEQQPGASTPKSAVQGGTSAAKATPAPSAGQVTAKIPPPVTATLLSSSERTTQKPQEGAQTSGSSLDPATPKEKSESNSPSSWLPSSWLGGGSSKPGDSS